MQVGFIQYLIVCPLVFLAGLVDAVAGGGGLISLPGYMIAGLPAHNALATNKMSSFMGTSMATYRYAKNGYVPWKLAVFCVVCALCGSSIGSSLALLLPDHIFKMIMLIVLPATAFYITRGKAFVVEKEPYPPVKMTLFGMAIAFVIGMYDGFYGPGTGAFLLLLFTSVAHLKLEEANGVAKVINLSSNFAALTVFITSGNAIIPLGLTAGCFSIAGNYIGTRFFEKRGAKAVRPIMIMVLAIFFVKTIVELCA